MRLVLCPAAFCSVAPPMRNVALGRVKAAPVCSDYVVPRAMRGGTVALKPRPRHRQGLAGGKMAAKKENKTKKEEIHHHGTGGHKFGHHAHPTPHIQKDKMIYKSPLHLNPRCACPACCCPPSNPYDGAWGLAAGGPPRTARLMGKASARGRPGTSTRASGRRTRCTGRGASAGRRRAPCTRASTWRASWRGEGR